MELLIRIKDKINLEDEDLNSMCLKAGDIVTMQPDGHNWGTKEKSNPDWRIISIPNMTNVEALEWLEPNYTVDEDGNKIFLPGIIKAEGLRRKYRFNFDAPGLDAEDLFFIADNTRTPSRLVMNGKSREQRDEMKQLKTGN